MAAAVRSAGPERLDQLLQQQGAGGLTSLQSKSLRAALLQIARSEEVELEDLSQFGDSVYRTSLRIRTPGGTSATLCMLLVRAMGISAGLDRTSVCHDIQLQAAGQLVDAGELVLAQRERHRGGIFLGLLGVPAHRPAPR